MPAQLLNSGTTGSNASKANAYLRTRVMTASPEELRLLLLEGAARFLRQGIDGLNAKDYERSFNGISQSRAIITELLTSVRPEFAPELVDRIRSLYSYIYAELVEGSFSRDVPRLTKILDLLEFERETWTLAIEKARQERASGTAPASHGGSAPVGSFLVETRG
jgi:flagellar protein FliS